MSTPTLAPPTGGFDDFEFEAMVAGLNGQARRSRPSRKVADDEAIRQSLGIYRHRTTERRD
ncbi:hypothetical protein AMIS_20270 [Actinoplanes missouriensis 431]|uniref:Uncharacterized protein n=1 Tax=Actinoplanes missouriensis (strain ATCC 14538 / DSM 43046 / CBS 188.64 / JCM 3121 / NBRC 102363 / NCIMB 12654 / NRRL B-3342 / UNCC 431) TaxID=512565 RepID=I0H2L0_ACTM4|nr:hypothetical protein [Actinoplanes missouriensis]BAL87247.1 hypothetical protein AMIS_20270 [Actinoplanes missouriensis 431]